MIGVGIASSRGRRLRARRVLVLSCSLVTSLLAACGAASARPSAGIHGLKVCEVRSGSAAAGLDSSAQSALTFTRSRLASTIDLQTVTTSAIGGVVHDGCRLIIAPSYQQPPSAILAAATEYPHQHFVVADTSFHSTAPANAENRYDFRSARDLTRPNVSVLAFEADQPAFLAGYIAAAVSPNHVVGEYGGVSSPVVDAALNGFLAGARAWGQDTHARVRILGWDGTTGPFVGNDYDRTKAFAIAQGLIHSGAHVLFGVAGSASLGSAAAAEQHRSVYLVGMYVDAGIAAPQYANRWLTSVVFDMRVPILSAASQAARGQFRGGLWVGTLRNGGVGLAPFRTLQHLVPNAVVARLPSLRAQLAQGSISTNPGDYVPTEAESSNPLDA